MGLQHDTPGSAGNRRGRPPGRTKKLQRTPQGTTPVVPPDEHGGGISGGVRGELPDNGHPVVMQDAGPEEDNNP